MCERHGLGATIQHLFGAPDTAPPVTETIRRGRSRLKLWELEDKHHCPVVGTCLSLDEIGKLARKGGFAGRNFDAYRLHVEAVSISCTRNPLSETMHGWLDRKYATAVRRFEGAKDTDQLLALWREHRERGEIAGAMWAALTHKAGDAASRQSVYADVHMLSHQIGAGQAADLRRLGWLEAERIRLIEAAGQADTRHARELARRDARLRQLEGELASAARRNGVDAAVRVRLDALESGVAMTGMARRLLALTDDVARLAARNAELDRRLAQATGEVTRLAEEGALAARERDALERLWLAQPSACAGECAACPTGLRDRCVLCVGGRTTLLPQYRQLAERLGVRLIHHDGGREEALSRLPALLASSDAVICPTDCVGHLAYYQLKQHCKQAGKPCVLVKSSGVASFAAALARLAEGRTEIQAN